MTGLRGRIAAGDRVVGCFGKIPDPHVIELLGLAGLDFIVADREHAAVGLQALDLMVMAGRSVGLPVLIRSTGSGADALWPAMDLGAAGVMVPHVRDGEEARAVVEAVKYAPGKRGFSPSGRAGAYGTMAAADYRAQADADSIVMAQIEDRGALDHLDAIAGTEGVDVLFVGPADLSLSLGVGMDAPELAQAIEQVVTAARTAGKQAGIFLPGPEAVPRWAALGVTVFVLGADQSLLMSAARQMMHAAKDS
ncbi:HpcH/HpaI aldolase family protein [Pseudooceanicola nanhaiensis]|uniref:HpcH/HpaI aldolase family protein n=1 Tax=Pseudooceanicola nanhaiensis TaxID=375761 RepID=UPI001CD37DD9|nr:aldolase/citrate lyase family protein [Pseudooceanicola nanhaiensis]MCA0920357.1 aldolase [Pseudooceanicola nanhaiensis]